MKLSIRVLVAGASLALGFALYEASIPCAALEPERQPVTPDIIFVEAPTVETGELVRRFPNGSRLVRFSPGKTNPSETNLTPDFLAAADPNVSADATQVLFSGKKNAESPWQVWEMNADGSNKHQITHCPSDCLRPAYLPRGQIVYTAMGTAGRSESALYVSEANGANPHPITFGPGDFQVETVLRDGRILVSARSSLVASERRGAPRSLFTIRPDGTGLTRFRPNARENLIRSGVQELADGTVLFVVKNGPASPAGGGTLAWIPRGAVHNSVITPQQSGYWSVRALDGGTLLVSKASARSVGARRKFDLYAFDLASRSVGKLIYRNPKFSSVQAVSLVPHSSARYYWSILHPQLKTGRVICLNAYLSADAPNGRLTTPIARVRVVMLGPDREHERVLGEAPVEKDGSFYVTAPADRPLRFELLDAQGRVIHAQHSWVWTRPGEDLGCLGCHDDKAMAPPNHWPLALERRDTPIALGKVGPTETAGH